MGYADHDDPGADAPGEFGAFRAVHHEDADGIRYADSGVLPDDGLRPGDVPRPDGDRVADGGRFPGAGSRADSDTGVYPVIDWYAGYEGFAGDQAGDRPTAAPRTAGEQPFRRVYARPADPRGAPSSGGEPGGMRDHGRRPTAGYPDAPPRAGYVGRPPRAGYPDELPFPGYPDELPIAGYLSELPIPGYPDELPIAGYLSELPIPGYPDESSLADYPAEVTLARRLAGLRPDRWIIAGGGLAAAVAVTIAFATAGGSTATRPATTPSATGHVTPPACVSPAPGH
jgi:hypothetical protein